MSESRKLGKLKPKTDPRTLMLASYIYPNLPPPPESVNWAIKTTNWPMFGNDRVGNCTCATAGHMVQSWTANAQRKEMVVSEGAVMEMYRAVTGYDGNYLTDTGARCLDVLKYWRNRGIRWPQGGLDNIGAYTYVNPRNSGLVKDGIYLMGGLYCGLALPVTAQSQTVWDAVVWDSTGSNMPGSWGGHCVNVVGYDSRGLTCVTWGALQRMTWAFWQTYCDECYAILDMDWINDNNRAPNGIDIVTLRQDLSNLK